VNKKMSKRPESPTMKVISDIRNELSDTKKMAGTRIKTYLLRYIVWLKARQYERRNDHYWDLIEHQDLKVDIKSINSKLKRKKRHTICIMDVRGLDINFLFVEAKDSKVKIGGRFITLPTSSYYSSNPQKLGKVKIKGPIPVYAKEMKSNGDLTISPVSFGEVPSDISLSGKTQSQILDESVLSSFLSSMQISKTQLFMFGSMGIVCWEIVKMILKIIEISFIQGGG
jgi:hypothetical protein